MNRNIYHIMYHYNMYLFVISLHVQCTYQTYVPYLCSYINLNYSSVVKHVLRCAIKKVFKKNPENSRHGLSVSLFCSCTSI